MSNCCLLGTPYAWLLYVMKNTYHELFRDFDFVSSFSLLCRVRGRHFGAHAIFSRSNKCCAFYLTRHDSLSTNTHTRTFTFPTNSMGISCTYFTNINLSRRRLQRVRLLFFNSALLFSMRCSILHTLPSMIFFSLSHSTGGKNKYFFIVLVSTVVLNYSVAPQFHIHTQTHAANHQ